MEIKFNQIAGEKFNKIFVNLLEQPVKPTVGKRLTIIAKQLDEKRAEVFKSLDDDVVALFAKKDGDGKVIRPAGPSSYDIVESKMSEYEAAWEEWGKRTVKIGAFPIKAEEIDNLKLTAKDIMVLDPIII